MSMPMLLYLETNWLVSCLLPHDRRYPGARKIFEMALENKYEIRIPEVAFLEARHVVERETKKHAQTVTEMAKVLSTAAENSKDEQVRNKSAEAAEKLKDAARSYSLPNPILALADFIRECERLRFSQFSRPIEEQRQLDELRALAAGFQGDDITDLYILAAIVVDRALYPERPAAFISTNEREFGVHRNMTKLPRDFYTKRKLVYLSKFEHAQQAASLWDKAESDGWPVPMDPHQDERIEEAKSILYGLPEHSRDAALQALQAIQVG